MAETKLDLPDSDHSWIPKVEAPGTDDKGTVVVVHDEMKDQFASDSSIPLSPQWLYSKPSETKMDMRAVTSVSLGNTNDPSQKEGWRLDGTDEKKDWRRVANENENNSRWREEERETGLLGPRRDRRKTDRRVDGVSVRETMENRVLPSSDRWHDGNNRNSGHETRRDSKWSSRWGPEDKEKESRSEKRTDLEREKDDAHNDNPSSILSNRSTSEREPESRDKWRPRHRMEVHSTGPTSYRAAPGFGLERGGRGESSNLGFAVGRGRSNAIGRASSIGTTAVPQLYRGGSVIGKPHLTMNAFCYPRGKLLDIYRQQKLDTSFAAMPDEMQELPSITQVGVVEPLAFVAPDDEEEAMLTDIWKGKITNSGVMYNSFKKGKSTESVTGVGEYEGNDGKLGILSPVPYEEPVAVLDTINDGSCPADGDHSSWNHDRQVNMLKEKAVVGEGNKAAVDRVNAPVLEREIPCNTKESTYSVDGSRLGTAEDGLVVNSFASGHIHSDGILSTPDVTSKLPDDSLFVLPSSDQDPGRTKSHLAINSETKDLEKEISLEDLYFYYIDPHGETQGPFLGADIMLWFEEGYFGTDLPIRLADAPQGTPFQSLGELIPRLKLRSGYPNTELEQSGALEGEPCLPSGDAAPENIDSSSVAEPLSDFNYLSAQHAQPRMSERENPLQLPLSEDQNFHDFTAQDEEIVFPGRPGSGGYSGIQSSGNVHDSLMNANSVQSLPNELTEQVLPYQSENKLHPFGLFWSELEGSQTRQIEHSDIPSSVIRSSPFSAITDPAPVAEKWPDAYRQEMLSVPNSFQDATAGRHMSLEQESNRYDLAEQLMSRQFQQQQLQQRNLLPSHPHLNQSLLETLPGLNHIHHQQLANHPDMEHLLALQLQQQQLQQQQQQRQLQLQQQHQLKQQQQLQQQQQFQQQQKLLQERQQSQARQVLLEQLLRGQIPDTGLPQSHVDSIRANNILDQVLLEQQLLLELQQRSHNPQRHFVPSMEQLAQAKFGQTSQHDQQRDMFELLSRAQHGQMQSLEHQILQEQLQARQLSMGLRQRNMEGERHVDSLWPVNENDHLVRSLAGNARASGINPLEFYQRQQRPPIEEQLNHLDRNLSFQDRLRQGLFEHPSMPYERSLSMPADASGMNMDIVNAMAHAHGLDMQELNSRMQSAGQLGALSSGNHPYNSHHPVVPNKFHVSHLDASDGRWPETSGSLGNDWMESQIQQLHISEQPRRESHSQMTAEDPSLWMSDGMNDDKSRRLLMELLNQKSGQQSDDSLHNNDGRSFEKRPPSGVYSVPSSVHPFGAIPDREANLSNSFAVGSYGSSSCESAEISLTGEQAINMGNAENLIYRSESGALHEGNSSLMSSNEIAQSVHSNSNFFDKPSINREYLEVEGRKYGSKSQAMTRPVSGIHNGISEQARLASADRVEVFGNPLSRHSSLGVSGFYDEKSAPQNSFVEDMNTIPVPVPTKSQENMSLRRPPVSRSSSSQEGISELISDAAIRGKSSSGVEAGNPANQALDAASGKKEARFQRSSSCSDTDASEPSFIDMLKSNVKKTTTASFQEATGSESSDGTQGGRSGKKKGKKGRQIDPALLGFKVTSNRIMMGEIQRADD